MRREPSMARDHDYERRDSDRELSDTAGVAAAQPSSPPKL
jgi:hypothetical protein